MTVSAFRLVTFPFIDGMDCCISEVSWYVFIYPDLDEVGAIGHEADYLQVCSSQLVFH